MNNRAMDYLNEAYRLLEFPDFESGSGKGRLLVRLAIQEVQELLAYIAELEGQHATPTALPRPYSDGRVLIVDAQPMIPARLTERQERAVEWLEQKTLPGNGRGL